MIQKFLFRVLMSPFALLYGVGVSFRNFLYNNGVLKPVEFNLPVIAVGNLSMGGAGKTPHIEYLVRLLKDYVNVATLSRGYKRKTKGFLEVYPNHNAETVGDEPLQFKRKFPDVMVTVSESRAFGIPEIVKRREDMQVVLLDDAFQHRSVQPGLNILLTEYAHPFTKDYLLPAGRLREWRSAYQRADVIIISKCPRDPQLIEKDQLLQDIHPLPHQKIFFSYYDYQIPYYLFDHRYGLKMTDDLEVLLISAIARTEYLTDYLEQQIGRVSSLEYEDHHTFTNYDIAQLHRNFEHLPGPKKAIITTEKDAMRLEAHREYLLQHRLPIFALPVEVKFHFGTGPLFDQMIRDYLLEFRV